MTPDDERVILRLLVMAMVAALCLYGVYKLLS